MFYVVGKLILKLTNNSRSKNLIYHLLDNGDNNDNLADAIGFENVVTCKKTGITQC